MKTYRSLILLSLLCMLFARTAEAQLAITEAMSSASTNLGPEQVVQNSDYWELTNFGTNQVDLTGYKFDDSDNNLAAADPTPFEGLRIDPGESIVFLQNNVNSNAASVLEWWGTNLPPTTKIIFYTGNGFSSTGDGIRFWGPNAVTAADVVDSVDFGEAVRGAAFTYDPVAGDFGILSTNGVGGAFKAATTDDVGSPGRTTGPTPLSILRQPTNAVVNPGDTARFTVEARGRPRGLIQWFFKGAAIAGATSATLELTNVQTEATGTYHATINNGVTNVTSASAELVLQSQASAPVITLAPADLTLTLGQSFTFRATATGVPQPTFEWRFGGTPVEGATGGEFLFSAAAEDQSGVYSVVARNPIGAATNDFHITVTPPPQLVITEVMSSALTNIAGHQDWWELSNLGTFPVPLLGYRFDDNSEMISAAFTFTNVATIAPGESVIFTETMTPEEFRAWWGAENLPPNLQIITYRGNGLSSGGDAVNVWNAAAAEDSDKVASAVFSAATAGVSFGFDPDTGQFGALSVAGTFGAFAAASGGDIGSPGYIRNRVGPAAPRITGISRTSTGVQLSWTAEAGKTYTIQSRDNLGSAGTWVTVQTVTATAASMTVDIPITDNPQARFYRIFTQ